MSPKTKHETTLVKPHPLDTEIYTCEDVAASLGVSVRTILRAIQSGKLKAKKTGKQFLITREAVREFWDNLPEAAGKK